MLREIKQLLQERKLISLAELSVYFDIDAFALEGMLDILVRKNKINRREYYPCESVCDGCAVTCQRERWIFFSVNEARV